MHFLRCITKISYKKLWMMLVRRDITKATMKKDLGIAAGTMSKLPRQPL